MNARAYIGLVALILLTGALPPYAEALYRWTDDTGEVHLTTRLEDVPERYRSQALPIAQGAPDRPASCASLPGAPIGGARIPFSFQREEIIVNACINGRGPVRLKLDTGLPRAAIVSPRVLERLGVDLKKAEKTVVGGITGLDQGLRLVIQSLELGGAKIGPVTIIAYEREHPRSDGLLGQEFLTLYRMDIDYQSEVITLTPR